MKSVLLNADNDHGWAARYQAALALARGFDGHIHCVQNTPFVDTGDSFFGFYPYPEIARELHEIGRQHRARAEDQLRGDGVEWDWLEVMDAPAQILIWRSRLADVTVVTSGGMRDRKSRPDDLAMAGSVAIHARSAILAVPPDLADFDPLGTALIAWNGSPEAAGALRSGMPMLKQAKGVLLVRVGEETSRPHAKRFTATEASDYLKRHAVTCEEHPWDCEDRSVADAVLDAAAVLGADYIVAGAYGHTRVREAVLGGTTRGLLTDSAIPVLMAH